MINTVRYVYEVRLSDALYGIKPVLNRNGKNLEITIPPRTKDGRSIKLTNALSITDGSPGDITVQIQVKPPPVINPTKGTNIDSTFQFCLNAIGSIANDHVKDYLDSRNSNLSRQLFFQKAVWAIWVAGWGQKQCDTFLAEAVQDGFTWNFHIFGKWSASKLTKFMQLRHLGLVPERARKKWGAVYEIAKWLNSFPNDAVFRQKVFRNVLQGRYLDKYDVSTLRNLKLPFIGEANSSYIIRMLGGEEIKDDKWIKEFRKWANLTFDQLERHLVIYKIPRGFFDVVTWEYCNIFIRSVSQLKPHFTSKFGFFV